MARVVAAALASHSLVVIDAESGQVTYTPQKFGDPIQLLEPGGSQF